MFNKELLMVNNGGDASVEPPKEGEVLLRVYGYGHNTFLFSEVSEKDSPDGSYNLLGCMLINIEPSNRILIANRAATQEAISNAAGLDVVNIEMFWEHANKWPYFFAATLFHYFSAQNEQHVPKAHFTFIRDLAENYLMDAICVNSGSQTLSFTPIPDAQDITMDAMDSLQTLAAMGPYSLTGSEIEILWGLAESARMHMDEI